MPRSGALRHKIRRCYSDKVTEWNPNPMTGFIRDDLTSAAKMVLRKSNKVNICTQNPSFLSAPFRY